MARGMETYLSMIRSTRDLSVATSTAKAIMRLGPDAVESIPTIINRSAQTGQFFFPYPETRWIEQCGPEAGTVALECYVRAFETATDAAYLIVVAGCIRNLLKEGARGGAVLPVLETHLQNLSVSHKENKKRLRGQMASDDSIDVIRFATTGAIVDVLKEAVKFAGANADATEPSLCDETIGAFVRRSLRRRAAIAMYFKDLGRVTDTLVNAIQARSPDAVPEDAIGKATESMQLQCPCCGNLSEAAMSHLILSAKGAYEPGAMGKCVVATGPKVSDLVMGQCPDCKGTLGILSADLSPLGLVPRKWWEFWK